MARFAASKVPGTKPTKRGKADSSLKSSKSTIWDFSKVKRTPKPRNAKPEGQTTKLREPTGKQSQKPGITTKFESEDKEPRKVGTFKIDPDLDPPELSDPRLPPHKIRLAEILGGPSQLEPLSDGDIDSDGKWVRTSGLTPIEYLTHTYRNIWEEPHIRIQAARALLEYAHKQRNNKSEPDIPAGVSFTNSDLSNLTPDEQTALVALLEKLRPKT